VIRYESNTVSTTSKVVFAVLECFAARSLPRLDSPMVCFRFCLRTEHNPLLLRKKTLQNYRPYCSNKIT